MMLHAHTIVDDDVELLESRVSSLWAAYIGDGKLVRNGLPYCISSTGEGSEALMW